MRRSNFNSAQIALRLTFVSGTAFVSARLRA
jgi:hypothetical protein